MMRIGLIVVGIGALTVMELGTPPRTKASAPDPFDQVRIDLSRASGDNLTSLDRIVGHAMPYEEPVHSASPLERVPPPTMGIVARKDLSTIETNQRGTTDKKTPAAKLKNSPKHTVRNKPRPKPKNSELTLKVDHPTAAAEFKPCQSNAFESLLQTLHLVTRCQI
jgi:hypothetical protein